LSGGSGFDPEPQHDVNRVMIYLEKILKTAAGDVPWGGPAKHTEENPSDQLFEVVVVEFKQ
jgi:hypothetical protein